MADPLSTLLTVDCRPNLVFISEVGNPQDPKMVLLTSDNADWPEYLTDREAGLLCALLELATHRIGTRHRAKD